MKSLSVLAAVAVLATSASGAFSNGTHFYEPGHKEPIKHFGCGVHRGHGTEHFLKLHEKLHREHKHSKAGTRAAQLFKKQVATPISVPTYFHVISSTANAGIITQDMANQQLAAMNTAYNTYGISFVLQNTSFTTNDAWAIAAGSDMDAAKAGLRVGTYGSLNIYFHTDLAGGNLGTCTLPSQVPAGSDPAMYVSDGCNVNANTMPGGTMAGYNQGKTAVHETGHWLGLLHTFEGYACTGDGDYITDTPMESLSTDGCPTDPAKNSCPGVSQGDPIHNYMDYSTDACYEQFTPGQISRISTMFNQYRLGM